jgi:hypothetical protein
MTSSRPIRNLSHLLLVLAASAPAAKLRTLSSGAIPCV